MSFEEADRNTGIDRRQFFSKLAGVGALVATANIPATLIASAEAQGVEQEAAYEKQEPKIPTVAEVDKIVRDALKEKEISRYIENKIFDGGDMLAGVEAFEFSEGINDVLGRLIARGKAFKRDTKSVEELHQKALVLRNIASEAHIQFMRQISAYVFVLLGSNKTDTTSYAERLRTQALTLARANDALVALRDKTREVLK